MCLLSIDTSGSQWSIAIQTQRTILGEGILPFSQGPVSLLVPKIQNLLHDIGLHFQDLKRIAVARGPGSFTGVRVGLSTAQGLSFALQCSLVALSSFEVVYHTLPQEMRSQEPFHVLLDTKGSLMGVCYFLPDEKEPRLPLYGTVGEIAAYLKGREEKIIGDGLERLLPFGDHWPFLKATKDLTTRAVSLGRYILTHASQPSWFILRPDYGGDLFFKTNG